VGDHREPALTRTEFGEARRLFVKDDAVLQSFLSEEQPAAIVIMSHNLQADARYLRLAAHCDSTYLGVLGPAQRRGRLLEGLEPNIRARLEPRLVGPMGLDIGADSPASIALSIVAQVFAKIKESSFGEGDLRGVRDKGRVPARSPAGSTDRTSVSE
jgi:xanthine/CO dehydrogenase XdhC/CoxF family maturation factor